MSQNADLNQLKIPRASEDHDQISKDPGMGLAGHDATSADNMTSVYFRDIETRIIENIQQADVVLGCVAWLTSFELLKQLCSKKGVSIIVQKEDFLRPDFVVSNSEKYSDWMVKLRTLYQDIPGYLTRRNIGGKLTDMRGRAYCSLEEELAKEWFIEDGMDAIRCVGVVSKTNARSSPRMHNKFLIFAQWDGSGEIKPYAVWTGSYNLSTTAQKSFENGLILRDPCIVDAYLREYQQIACLSESLDWKSPAAKPEWWYAPASGTSRFDPLAGEY